MTQPSGPTYVDYPLDVVFMEGEAEVPSSTVAAAPAAARADEAAALLAEAERPVIMAGTGVYWARAEDELRLLAESLGIPVYLNGMGRGCLPADHELCFSRTRGEGLEGGGRRAGGRRAARLPARVRRLDRRGDEADLARRERERADREPDAGPRAGRRNRRDAGGDPRGGGRRRRPREDERLGRGADRRGGGEASGRGTTTSTTTEPPAPAPDLQRARADARPQRDRDRRRRRLRELRRARGGDVRTRLLDGPGAVRMPGRGAGAGDRGQGGAHPTGRSCACSATEPSASAAWSSTRWSATASPWSESSATTESGPSSTTRCAFFTATRWPRELRQATRYDEVVQALGGHGELVRHPSELQPALERAFASGKPALVNVLTDRRLCTAEGGLGLNLERPPERPDRGGVERSASAFSAASASSASKTAGVEVVGASLAVDIRAALSTRCCNCFGM